MEQIKIIGKINRVNYLKYKKELSIIKGSNHEVLINSIGGPIKWLSNMIQEMIDYSDKSYCALSIADEVVSSSGLYLHQCPRVKLAYPNTVFGIHRHYLKENVLFAREVTNEEMTYYNLLINPKLDIEKIIQMANGNNGKGTWLDVTEAVEYGLVHHIIER